MRKQFGEWLPARFDDVRENKISILFAIKNISQSMLG